MNLSRIANEAERLTPVAHEVLSRYDLLIKDMSHLATHSNVLYRVITDSGRQLVLRVGTPDSNSRSNIQYEVDWLTAIHEQTRLDVVAPIATASGRLVTDIEDPETGELRNCVLFSWVPGEPLADGAGSFGYRLLGQMSAKLHKHGRSWLPEDPKELRHWNQVFYYSRSLDPVVIFDTRYQHLFERSHLRTIEKAIPIAGAVIDASWKAGRPQIVHGDLHEWNVHIAGTRLFAFDFEDVMVATPAQDVSISLYSSRAAAHRKEIRAAFREGFEEHSVWPIQDDEQLDGLHAARQVMLMNYAVRSLPEAESGDYLADVMPWLQRYVARYG